MTIRTTGMLLAAVCGFSMIATLTVAEENAVAAKRPSPIANDDVQDILYLGDDRLIVIRLHVRVDGKSYAAVWNEYVDELFRDLDANGDKALTGKEIAGIQSFSQVSRGRVYSSPNGVRQLTPNSISADVKPRDGKVTRDELAAYLKRAGAKPFTVSVTQQTQSRIVYSFGGRTNSGDSSAKLFKLLDRDENGKLSKSELANAIKSLRKYDLDEDETISIAELSNPGSPFLARRIGGRTPGGTSAVFISLASGISPLRLVRQLIDKYDRENVSAQSGEAGKNNKLSAAELGLDESAMKLLDADGDGQLDFTELRQFLKKPIPSVEIVLRLGRTKPGKPVVELVNSADNLESKVKVVSESLANLVLANVNLDINVDTTSGGEWDPTRTYDRQFDRADTDNNGYLDEKEVRSNGVFRNSFAAMDRDKDGKVFKKEMQAYVKSQSRAARSRTVLAITDQGRDLFKILDLNRDQRLSYAEFESAVGRVAAWDADNDRQISKTEIPRQYRLTLQRGRPGGLLGAASGDVAYPGGSRVSNSSPTGGPLWFQRMDVNRDGEVSRSEFLGELKVFQRLDKNNNGRINISEAADAKGAK